MRMLCSDSQHALTIPRPIIGCRNNNSTATDVQSQRLQHIRLRLKQYIPSDNPTICDTMFDIDRNIHWLNEDETKAPALVFNCQSPRRDVPGCFIETSFCKEIESATL